MQKYFIFLLAFPVFLLGADKNGEIYENMPVKIFNIDSKNSLQITYNQKEYTIFPQKESYQICGALIPMTLKRQIYGNLLGVCDRLSSEFMTAQVVDSEINKDSVRKILLQLRAVYTVPNWYALFKNMNSISLNYNSQKKQWETKEDIAELAGFYLDVIPLS